MMTHALKRSSAGHLSILASLILLLVFMLTFPAQAQTVAEAQIFEGVDLHVESQDERPPAVNLYAPYAHKSVAWWDRLDKQLAQSLDSRTGDIREDALQLAVTFGTLYRTQATFEETVPELVRVYARSVDERHRMMALAALHAIGDPYGMERLRELVSAERSERIRKLTYAALAHHEATAHQGTLAHEDAGH